MLKSINSKIQKLDISIINVAIVCFCIVFFLQFIYPVFLLTDKMIYYRYIKDLSIAGADLKFNIDMGKFSCEKIFFTPFAKVIFNMLSYCSFKTTYKILSLLSLLGLVISVLIIPAKLSKKKINTVTILIFVMAAFSYPFQFEVERGQWNILVIALMLTAIYLFHNNNLFGAVVLFSLAVQLKLYPAIFILAFVKDYSKHREIIKYWSLFFIVNFLLLFVLGVQNFYDYTIQLINYASKPYIWFGNLSLTSYAAQLNLPAIVKYLLLLGYFFSLFLIIRFLYKNKKSGIDAGLIFMITIGTLLIPSVSHDYRLSILFPVVAYFFMQDQKINSILDLSLYIAFFGCYFFISFSYAAFSYITLPALLHFLLLNKTTAVLIITATVAFISVRNYKKSRTNLFD